MAEGFLSKYLKSEEGFEIVSAGISGMKDLNPTEEAIEAMKEENIDISSYKSTPLSEDLVKSADVILVMTQLHKEFIIPKFPEARDKIYLFKEFAELNNVNPEIVDPIGQPVSFYKKIRDEIKKASIAIAKKLKGA